MPFWQGTRLLVWQLHTEEWDFLAITAEDPACTYLKIRGAGLTAVFAGIGAPR